MSNMIIHKEGWKWQPDLCPADQDFIEYGKSEIWMYKHIFQMGTGLHHEVARAFSKTNHVVGVTCCPEEMQEFMHMVIEDPIMLWGYECLFSDLYCMDFNIFAGFDVIYLPHLGEMQDQNRKLYTERSDRQILEDLKYKLNLDGIVVGYSRSAAQDRAIPLMDEMFKFKEAYKSLRIYTNK